MTELLHQLAAVGYGIAGILTWRRVTRGHLAALVPVLLVLAALVHAVGFVALHREQPPIPMESFPAALSLIGWLIVVSYLLSMNAARIRGIASWVALVAAAITGLAWVDLIVGPARVLDRAGSGAWSHAHVLLSTLGFSCLALASVAGIAYLVKQRALKRKSAGGFGLPALESLDRMSHFTLSVGFPLLTLGVATGFIWVIDQGLSPWTAHTFWLLAAWAVYLAPVVLRVVRQQHGERPARAVVLGFAVLAFGYVGVRLLGGGA